MPDVDVVEALAGAERRAHVLLEAIADGAVEDRPPAGRVAALADLEEEVRVVAPLRALEHVQDLVDDERGVAPRQPVQVDLDALASRTERFTGADLEDLSRRAGLIALRQSLSVDAVTMAHFEAALEETRASVTPEMEREYEQIQATLKQSAMQLDPIGFVSPGMLRARER